MTDITREPIAITEREQNIRKLFGTLYDILRKFSAQSQNDIENLKSLSRDLHDVIEKTAEYRAKVICGEYIRLIRGDMEKVLNELKSKSSKPQKGYKTFDKDSDETIQALPTEHPDKV